MTQESETKPQLIQLTPEQHIAARTLYYESVQGYLKHTMEMQGAQGRWLIASLLLIHGSVFAFLAQSDRLSTDILPHVFLWLAAGIVLALCCGFVTWWNWSLASMIYAEVQPWMIYNGSQIEFGGWRPRMVTVTMWLAVVFGLASVACVCGIAWTSYQIVHPARIMGA